MYLDANVLVAGLIRSQPLFPNAAALMGELLVNRTPIVLSDIAVSESIWVLAKIAYCDLMNQRYSNVWTPRIYHRHYAQLFSSQGAKVNALRQWLHALDVAGHPIDVVASTRPQWLDIVDRTHIYMQRYGLTTNDAAHLAVAEVHARTFITADKDYNTVAGAMATGPLTVLLLN